MPYRLSALSEQDLDEIWFYVAEDASPATADRLIAEVSLWTVSSAVRPYNPRRVGAAPAPQRPTSQQRRCQCETPGQRGRIQAVHDVGIRRDRFARQIRPVWNGTVLLPLKSVSG